MKDVQSNVTDSVGAHLRVRPLVPLGGAITRRAAPAKRRAATESRPYGRTGAHGGAPLHLSVYAAALLLALLFCPLTARAQPRAEAPNGPPVGTSAPTFVLPDLQGRAFRLEDYKGQTVVLNFWAFWCDTWKAELPSLKELSSRQGEMNFKLVAVSVDGARLSEFARQTGGDVPFPVLLDGGGRVSVNYRVRHVPTVVIIGPDGVVRFTASGYPGNHVILRELRKIASGK